MKIGIVGYAVKSGIGYLIKDYKKFLPIDTHYVIGHERYGVDNTMTDKCCVYEDTDAKQWVKDLKKLIVIEQPKCKGLLREATRLNIDIYCSVNADWFNHTEGWVKRVKTFICPNIYTWTKLFQLGFKNIVYIPASVDTDYFEFKQRDICNEFLFNNGWGGFKDRKGLAETIEIFKETNYPLIINSQKEVENNLPNNIKVNYKNFAERKDIYDKGDVLVYPTKWEGHALSTLETMACGIPVLTTNGVPMNEYGMFLIRTQWCKQNFNNDFTGLEFIIDKKDLLKQVDNLYKKDISVQSKLGREIIEQKYSWKSNKDKFFKTLGL